MPDVVNNPVPINPSPAISENKTEAAEEILTLLPKEHNGISNISDVPGQHAQEPKTASPLPYPELPGLGTEWLPTTDEKILRKKHATYLEHTKLLSQGILVEDIKHPSKFAVWACGQGCQCVDCKRKRNEHRADVPSEPGPMDSPKAFSSFLSKKFFARLLCLPYETAEAVCKYIHAPSEAQELWKVSNEDIKLFEDFGQFVMDNYLHVERYKHAQLAAFIVWYTSKFGTAFVVMKAMLTKEDKKK